MLLYPSIPSTLVMTFDCISYQNPLIHCPHSTSTPVDHNLASMTLMHCHTASMMLSFHACYTLVHLHHPLLLYVHLANLCPTSENKTSLKITINLVFHITLLLT